ncbi:UDP-glucosyltransferase 2-like [Nymphalis io]|uniref:UDP-glucosyltransferase 2-like n=1 Tax=Inachis io TaxID=171585 RepID=UPI00216A0667|nr:UDP-glucosyltransferase 2-like [Nymphalis io]
MVLHKIAIVFLLLYFWQMAESASILALFSSLSFSDHIVFRGYISLLAQKGHSIVVMTPYPGHFSYPDIEKIVELNVGEESAPYWEEYRNLMIDTDDYYPRMREINDHYIKVAVAQLKSKPMTALFINPNVKFDLVITEADVPVLYAVADKYQVPHIAITPSSGKIHQYESKGSPIHPILYPDVNSLNYRNLSRWQKIVEINRHFQTRNEYYYNYLPRCEVAARRIFGLTKSLQDIEYDIDLLFVAANPLLIGNRPSPPAITYVDRLHIRPGFQLPEELRRILDSASKGVIYFSLGAIQEPEHLSVNVLQTLVDAFRELPFLVLWKISNTTVVDIPKNVIAHAWFPQQEVLAHPNVKAFITHGGARSLEEALFYEVPIIGLPIVRSRKVFIGEIIRYGAGEILDPYYLEKENLMEIITSVATDDKYKKSMSKLKNMVVDPIISGPENAVWYTEFLLRHGSTKHLRNPAVGLSIFKYYMLDMIGILLFISITLLTASFYIVRYVLKRIRKRILQRFVESSKFKAL